MRKKEETPTLEQALSMLEEISEKMAADGLPLEESLALYEKSVRLVALCQNSLQEARLKIVSLEGGGRTEKAGDNGAAETVS